MVTITTWITLIKCGMTSAITGTWEIFLSVLQIIPGILKGLDLINLSFSDCPLLSTVQYSLAYWPACITPQDRTNHTKPYLDNNVSKDSWVPRKHWDS